VEGVESLLRLLHTRPRYLKAGLGQSPPLPPEAVTFTGGVSSPLNDLPADLRDFTGREHELNELDALLNPAATALIISAVDGTAGVGKPKPGS